MRLAVSGWGDVRIMMKRNGCDELLEYVKKVESGYRMDQVGKDQFKEALTEFRKDVADMGAGFSLLESNKKAGQEKLLPIVQRCPAKLHNMRQLAQYSETPTQVLHHLDVVPDFVSRCENAHRLWPDSQKPDSQKQQKLAKDEVCSPLVNMISRCLSEEVVKVTMVWLLGESGAASLLDTIKMLDKVAKPQVHSHIASTVFILKSTIACIEKALSNCEKTE